MSAPVTRTARIERTTKESKVLVELDLDGSGRADISTGVGFYDHMLTSLARHALVDLTVQTDGDTHVDAHHSVEDTAIVLGQALHEPGPPRDQFGHELRHIRFLRPARPHQVSGVGEDVVGHPNLSHDLLELLDLLAVEERG